MRAIESLVGAPANDQNERRREEERGNAVALPQALLLGRRRKRLGFRRRRLDAEGHEVEVTSYPLFRYPPYDVYPPDPASGSATGVLASASGASAEKGALLFNEFVDGISSAMTGAFGLAAI